jgi:hypothetical protein
VPITTVILLALATFVAYMRWKVKPILPRMVPQAQAFKQRRGDARLIHL